MRLVPEALVRIPSIASFLDRVADAAVEGKNVLVRTAGFAGATVIGDGLRGTIHAKGPLLVEVSIEGRPPEEIVAEALEVPVHDCMPGGGDSGSADPVTSVVLVKVEAGVDVSTLTRWLDFLRKGARSPWRALFTVVVVVTAPFEGISIPSDLRLAVIDFFDVVSALEMQLLCRLIGHGERSFISQWREALLPSVCAGDLAAMEALFDCIERPLDEQFMLLRDIARQRGVHAPREFVARNIADPKRRTVAVAQWDALFLQGAATCTTEYGREISAVALAAAEEKGRFLQRAWRGIATLLLPRLDAIRVAVCDLLTELHGREWVRELIDWKDELDRRRAIDDPKSIDYGPLVYAVRHQRSRVGAFVPLVEHARWTRNELAHYRPVSFSAFERLELLARGAFGERG